MMKILMIFDPKEFEFLTVFLQSRSATTQTSCSRSSRADSDSLLTTRSYTDHTKNQFPFCVFSLMAPVNRVDDRLAGHPALLSRSAGRAWPRASALLPTHPNICTLQQPQAAYHPQIFPNSQILKHSQMLSKQLSYVATRITTPPPICAQQSHTSLDMSDIAYSS